MYQFNRKEYEERMKWYQDARFGMFIHWGLYSIPARGEWVGFLDGNSRQSGMNFGYVTVNGVNSNEKAEERIVARMRFVVYN